MTGLTMTEPVSYIVFIIANCRVVKTPGVISVASSRCIHTAGLLYMSFTCKSRKVRQSNSENL